MSRNIQIKHTIPLPAVDSTGPAAVPRKFASREMRDAAKAALARRGIVTHPWNGRALRKP